MASCCNAAHSNSLRHYKMQKDESNQGNERFSLSVCMCVSETWYLFNKINFHDHLASVAQADWLCVPLGGAKAAGERERGILFTNGITKLTMRAASAAAAAAQARIN